MDINTLCMVLGLTPEQTAWIAAILGVLFAISEALALIPSVKSNSVFQLIFNFLKKVTGKAVAALGILMLTVVLLAGCAGSTVVKSVEAVKITGETILIEAKVMNSTGKLSDTDFAKVKKSYDSLAAAQNLAIDFRIAYLQSKAEADRVQYEAYLRNLPLILNDLIALAKSLGIDAEVLK